MVTLFQETHRPTFRTLSRIPWAVNRRAVAVRFCCWRLRWDSKFEAGQNCRVRPYAQQVEQLLFREQRCRLFLLFCVGVLGRHGRLAAKSTSPRQPYLSHREPCNFCCSWFSWPWCWYIFHCVSAHHLVCPNSSSYNLTDEHLVCNAIAFLLFFLCAASCAVLVTPRCFLS